MTVGIFCEPSHVSQQQILRIRIYAIQPHKLTRMPLSYTMFPGTAFTSMNMIGILQQLLIGGTPGVCNQLQDGALLTLGSLPASSC